MPDPQHHIKKDTVESFKEKLGDVEKSVEQSNRFASLILTGLIIIALILGVVLGMIATSIFYDNYVIPKSLSIYQLSHCDTPETENAGVQLPSDLLGTLS